MKLTLSLLFAALLTTQLLAQQTVRVDGSRTMAEANAELAREFMKRHGDIKIEIAHTGTQYGIDELIKGSVDIAATSRPLNAEERSTLKKSGGEIHRTVVALEGVSIYVHPRNHVREISLAQLADIYLGKIVDWSHLGGIPGPIDAYAREDTTGKYYYFREEVLHDQRYPQVVKTAVGEQKMIDSVMEDEHAIGYGPVGTRARVGLLAIRRAPGEAAHLPTVTEIKARHYPLIRELAYNTRSSPTAATKAFVDWVAGPEGQAILQRNGFSGTN